MKKLILNHSKPLLIAIAAVALVSTAAYSYQHSSPGGVAKVSDGESISVAQDVPGHHASGKPGENGQHWDDSDFIAGKRIKPFTAGDIQYHLKSFFARFSSPPTMTRSERAAFAENLLTAIDADPLAKKAVAEFYSQLPAKDLADREILWNMLALSSQGRSIVRDEANRIWESKDESLYSHMYQTYLNLPDQAPPGVMAHAISSLSDNLTDTRTEVAALNYIGTLEKDDSVEAGKMRTNAITQLNSVVSSNSPEVIRGVAAQQIYQLSSPEAAADAAVGFLRQGANTQLVMQTLNSINSGDVELTAPLRSTLASAIARPSATSGERSRFEAVVNRGHS